MSSAVEYVRFNSKIKKITELEIFKFDNGKIPQNCERELLEISKIRYNSNYDIDGKNEFFKYESLEEIKKTNIGLVMTTILIR
jgi:hypothetical protein